MKAPSARAGAAAAPAAVARAGVLPVRSPLARPTEVVFRGAGDLPLTGWLYQPPRLRGPVRPGAGHPPGPAFLWLHGGPECQERPVFSPLLQALAARGITVLAPNVRGSAGYGRAFERSDDLAGRFGAIADVAACWEYLVGSGLADPARVGIGGRSYGGYLTLAALVTYPRLFRAGVDVCGMSDLETFYADTEPWIAAAAVTKYGDPVADQDLLRALSPVHRLATDLAAPLLVVHGANDTNVGVREAAQAVAAVADGGGTCQQLYFLDEGHDIARRANRLRFVREVTRWLADHLLDGTPATPPAQRHGRQPATDR
ncbi:MAG: S9 family peptidase [Frankia sp.]|nr:S9 family peptidase [Frankia sp.]